MIPYTLEYIMDGDKKVGFLFHFSDKLIVLEEFFYGDVANFPSLISKCLEEAMAYGDKTFAGNSCVLKAKGDISEIVPLFGEDDSISVDTKELYDTVMAYRGYKKKFGREDGYESI